MKTLKSTFLIVLFFTISSNVRAQVVHDSVSVQPGYENISFYSLQDGEKANVSNKDWDIAFSASGFGAAIRLNTQKGNKLYAYPNGTNMAWTTFSAADTNGMSTWGALYDSDTDWSLGAFNVNADPQNNSDLGWGIYNVSTHHINGDSLYVIVLDNGDVKKLDIKRLASGVYTFRYANLDGSSLVDTSVDKGNYSGKNFAYYSLQTNQEFDKEPMSSDWDLAFTKYSSMVAPGAYYGVTGVLHNSGVKVAKAAGIANPHTTTNYSAHTFDQEINTVGYDWKSYNFMTNSYDIQDSLAFFVEAKNGNIWRLVLTDFEGSSTGKIKFEKELLAFPTAVNSVEKEQAVAFYPNPVVNNNLHVVFNAVESAEWNIQLFSLNGRLVKSQRIHQTGFVDFQISMSNLPSGTYFAKLSNNKGFLKTDKIILNK